MATKKTRLDRYGQRVHSVDEQYCGVRQRGDRPQAGAGTHGINLGERGHQARVVLGHGRKARLCRKTG